MPSVRGRRWWGRSAASDQGRAVALPRRWHTRPPGFPGDGVHLDKGRVRTGDFAPYGVYQPGPRGRADAHEELIYLDSVSVARSTARAPASCPVNP